MPNFKPKAIKKIRMNKKSILTLDNQHSNKMKEFHEIEHKTIPSLKLRKKYLKQLLQTKTTIENILNIKDEIKDIKKKLKILSKKKRSIC